MSVKGCSYTVISSVIMPSKFGFKTSLILGGITVSITYYCILIYYLWDVCLMYVSITGLKPKGLIGWIRFLTLSIPASKAARKAEGVLHCAFSSRNGYKHTLTVWKSKEHMLAYLTSPSHLKAMKFSSKIGRGKVYGYEASSVPSWEDAFTKWDESGRVVTD